jgi:hypothetical protein
MTKFEKSGEIGCSGFGSFRMKINRAENMKKTRRQDTFEA